MLFYKMARKSMKKNNSMKRSNSNRKQKRSKKQTGGAKRGANKSTGKKGSGGKLGDLDLNNLDNNKFWCMMCGRKNKAKGIVQGKDVKLETTKNGRKALKGKCAACDCKVFRFC